MKISQREARALKKRVAELEDAEYRRRSAWVSQYPGGAYLKSMAINEIEWNIVRTARKLKHAVVVIESQNTYELHLYALPPAKDEVA